MASDSITRTATRQYYARIVDEKVVSREDWNSDLAENVFAIFFGCFIAAYVDKYATSSIEYILLNNFPRFSRYWCYAKKGWKQSRLYWVQDSLQAALCVIVFLMRWPGWKLLHLHLWQCITYGILAYTVFETCMVMALVVLQIYLWTGDQLAWRTGWDPLLVNEKREELMLNARLEGPAALYRFRQPDTGLLHTRIPRRAHKGAVERNFASNGPDADRGHGTTTPQLDHPATVAGQGTTDTDSNGVLREVTAWTKHLVMNTPGSALKLRKQKAASEYARSQCHGEQRLHPSSTGPAPSTAPGDSAVAKDDVAGVISSNGSIFPEWMRGRSLPDSIFGSSLASSQSRDSPCPLPENVAVASTAKGGKGKDVSSSGTGVPDLLTGSPIRSRKFL